VTPEHARDELREIVSHVQRVRLAIRGLERWRATREYDRVYLIVEPTAEAMRVCDVLPATGARPRDRPRAPPPQPSAAPPKPPRRARYVESSAAPSPEPRPERVVPDVDPLLLLRVHDEIRRGTYPSATEIARKLPTTSREEIRRALLVLEQHVAPVPPKPRPGSPPRAPRAPGPPRQPRKAHWREEAEARARNFRR
jgi:hypothetical protein